MLRANPEKRKKKKTVLLAVFLVFLAIAVYFLFFSDFFKIKEVSVSGNKIASAEEIKNLFSYSYIFWPIKESGSLPPAVKEAKVLKNFLSRGLKIEVTEKKPYALWCFGETETGTGTCRWFDKDGFVFMNSPLTEGSFIKSIYGDRDVEIGEFIIAPELFKNLEEIFSILDRTGIEAGRFEISDIKQEEITAYAGNLPIFFSLRDNSAFTEKALNTLKPKFSSLSYIDLRSSGKAFYK